MTADLSLTAPISFESVGARGHSARIEPDAPQREAIAAAYDLLEVPVFAADMLLERVDKDTVAVAGRLTAEVTQPCVVSLDPVIQIIDETFRVRVTMPDSPITPPPGRPGAEVHVDPEEDPPEVVVDGHIDISGIILEHFSLAIDPYPRADGVAMPGEYRAQPSPDSDSPFAALSKLAEGR